MKTTTIVDDGKRYPYPPPNYTGNWIALWPSGKTKFRGSYIDGKEEGDQLCYWENGVLAQEGRSVDGVSLGIWKDYWDDGALQKITEYHSKRDFVQTWFDSDGSVREVVTFKDGIKQEAEQAGHGDAEEAV